MNTIKELFDQKIDRRIEKVIQFNTSDEKLLEQEIREYVATDAIQYNFNRVLDAIDEGMQADTEHEIGVWVSGFYGSGKSSFTKYLGFALDGTKKVSGEPFHNWLANRFTDQPLQQRLKTVAKKYPLSVILVDLSTDSLAQAGVAKISSVLYNRVLQWAGFSKDQKIAHFEFMLEKEGRYDELRSFVREQHGKEWDEVHNNPILGNKIASKAAVQFYPTVFPTEKDFSNLRIDLAVSEKEQVEDMLSLIHRTTGNPHVLFILDEVGQYIANSNSLTLNLQGFAQNLRAVGRGKAWFIATAQQTLTDSLGAPQFFKLQARFPITVHLEATDIREITHKRLLSKKNGAAELLAQRFDEYGAKLNLYTKLEDAKGYPTELDKNKFINLYPFLPQHFDVLLNVIGLLARTTGGTGLRSAIKVVQETLVGAEHNRKPFAEVKIGRLVTIADFFDVLRADIERSTAVRFVVPAVDTVIQRYGGDSVEAASAKGVAVMQILDDFPLTRKNLASLLIPSMQAQDNTDSVSKSVQNMIDDRAVPLEEVDGRLRFLSDRVAELQREWESLIPTSADKRAELQKVLQDQVFAGAPKAMLFGSKRISAHMQLFYGNSQITISGSQKEEISLQLRLEASQQYQDTREQLLQDSVNPGARNLLVLLGQESEEITRTLEDLYRSNKMIMKLRGNFSDAEVSEFYKSLNDRQRNSTERLTRLIRDSFWNGVFIFRNKERTPASQALNIDEAAREMLRTVGEQVFEHFPHASANAGQDCAEKLMKANDLSLLTQQDDPLGLVDTTGSDKVIKTEHAAMEDIRSYLDTHGHVEGKKLMDHFTAAPYGWSKDTIRYLTAALFTAGMLSFRINSKNVTTRTAEAIDMIKTNPNFNKLGIFLRQRTRSIEEIKRAADALTRLTGDSIIPLENKVEEAGMRVAQEEFTKLFPLKQKITQLGITGEERANASLDSLKELSSGNGDMIVSMFASPDKELEQDIEWMRSLQKSLNEGFEEVLNKVYLLTSDIPLLPQIGLYAQLKEETEHTRVRLKELTDSNDVVDKRPEIQQLVSEIDGKVTETIQQQKLNHEKVMEDARENISNHPNWQHISQEEKEQLNQILNTAADVGISADPSNLAVLRQNINREYERNQRIDHVRSRLDASTTPPAEAPEGFDESTIITVPKGAVNKRNAEQFIIKAQQRLQGLDENSLIVFKTGD